MKRFWNKVDRRGPDECWEWLGCINENNRYGMIRIGGRKGYKVKVHRFSWEIANGPIPKDQCVLHSCDNPKCVNPRHLFLGTQVDNIHDMCAKGRQSSGDLHGEKSGTAKLSEGDVLEIRRRYAEGKYGIGAKLSREYGVAQSQICRIIKGRRWAHL